MNKLITMFMALVMSASAFADQLVFSQYDGVNSWDNVYIEVQDAKAFPGGFIDGVRGYTHGGSAGFAGVEGREGRDYQPAVPGVAASETFAEGQYLHKTWSRDTTYTADEPAFGNTHTVDRVTVRHTVTSEVKSNGEVDIHSVQVRYFTEAEGGGSLTREWDVERTMSKVEEWTGRGVENPYVVSYQEAKEALEAQDEVEEEEAVAAKPATREDPQVRRTIVSVPEGVDMQEFISNFFEKHTSN